VNAVYLDYAATTPLDPLVRDGMAACIGDDGLLANPASIHIEGRRTAAMVADARESLAALLNTSPERLVWTSGATESNNLAIRGTALARAHRGKHLVTMPTEHKAVSDTFKALEKDGFEVTWLMPGNDGQLDPDQLQAALREDTQLVSIMHVNNETGVIQDIEAIGQACRARGVPFHTDAAQSVGKLPIDLEVLPVDLLSLTAHKFYGPQGIGALYIADRPGCTPNPILHGGGQERRMRPGTLPVQLVVGAGTAAKVAAECQAADFDHMVRLRDRLWRELEALDGLTFNSPEERCYPGILNVAADGVEGESLMLGLEPVCAASGSACNSTSGESSFVLRSLGRSDLEAQSAVRFSFGRMTTTADIDLAARRYRETVDHLRSMAPVT
jgi:cysteine desulfurase